MSMMNKVISFDKVDMQRHLFFSGTPTIPEVNFSNGCTTKLHAYEVSLLSGEWYTRMRGRMHIGKSDYFLGQPRVNFCKSSCCVLTHLKFSQMPKNQATVLVLVYSPTC